ncbi:hypothetical protein [Sphingopyxis terrae]|uniref:hypothetical protein n=1 Tax=Sphingopyxis terrae TaxID=33052 RepID=UPI003F8039F2
MIANLQILSDHPDLAYQALQAMQSPAVGQLLRIRMSHFDKGHDQASDDATSYAKMLENFGRDHFQPILDRTRGNASAVEVRAAATAALKGAARLLALADKAHRHAARLEKAESLAAEQARQED